MLEMLFNMADTKNQLSLTVLWFVLSWQLLSVAAIPVSQTVAYEYQYYRSGYSSNYRETWNFTTDDTDDDGDKVYLLLSFPEIDIERFFDYITVGDGTTPSPESQVLIWSGERIDDELLYLSSGQSLWLTFQSDYDVNLLGFSFRVETVPKSYTLPCSANLKCGTRVCLTRHDICDGIPNCANGFDEECNVEVAVNGPTNVRRSYGDSDHGNNHKFTWLFVTTPDSRIQLSFDYINTERHYDFVTVGDGSELSKNVLLTFSGEQDVQLLTVTSSGESMWLTLSTDKGTLISKGFSANLIEIDTAEDCSGDTFDCMNGVCLPSRFRCDKIAQCGTGSDESDRICQESCPLSRMCIDGQCLALTEQCDENIQCLNSFDEHGCTLRKQLGDFKQTFNNHAREIIFTAARGEKVFLTFYLPQQEIGNTIVTVTDGTNTGTPYSLNGIPAPGFYRLTSGSEELTLNFRTDSEIAISAISVASGYKYCPDGFQCLDGLQCIPYELSCDGVEHCQDKSDERSQLCGEEMVPLCVMDSEQNCTEGETKIALTTIEEMLQKEDLTEKELRDIADTLEAITDETTASSTETVNSIVNSITAIVGQDENGANTDSVISVVDDLYRAEADVLSGSSNIGAVSFLLEEQIGNVLSTNRSYAELTLENVRATAVEVEETSLQDETVTYGTVFAGRTSREELTNLTNFSPPDFISTGVATSSNVSHSITLSRPFLQRYTTGRSRVPLTFISYKDGSVFPISSESIKDGTTEIRKAVSSQVISASIPGQIVTDLPDEQRIVTKLFSFPVANKCEKEQKRECVFWKYDKATQEGEWSPDGCTLENNTEDEHVTCSCNHLTSFAILVHVSKEAPPESVVLDIISLIGCVLSILGLLICVITIFAIKKLRDMQKFRVHVNLCIALIAFYLTFLIGIDRTVNPLGCKIIASLIHFFCLSSMAWMSVEAVLLYNLVYKLNQADVKHLLPVGMAFAWGVPLVVTVVVAFLDRSHDYECFPDYCFLHPGLGLYLGFLLLIVLMFVFNTVLFFMINCKFACRKIMTEDAEKKRKEIAGRVRGTVLFWLLLGMSWIFGLLAAIPSPVKILFDILFSIFLAVQGLAMFYLLTFNNPTVKKLLKRLNCFGENTFRSSTKSRPTIKSNLGSHKSQSNDETGQSSAVETDTKYSSSQPQVADTLA